jgi:hypothetical protein
VATYYTDGQIGDGAVPGAHTANAAAAGGDRASGYPSEANEDQGVHVGSRWKARSDMSGMAGPGFDGSTTAEHYSGGAPDSRRQWQANDPAGYSRPAGLDQQTQVEQTANTRDMVPVAPQSPPVMNKAGSTGADAHRPASMPRWLFNRVFGQWAADQAPAIVKIEALSPLASTPYAQHEPTEHGAPSPGGNGITVTGFGVDSAPNTYRLLPRQWDEQLTVSDPAAPLDVPARRRWRL